MLNMWRGVYVTSGVRLSVDLSRRSTAATAAASCCGQEISIDSCGRRAARPPTLSTAGYMRVASCREPTEEDLFSSTTTTCTAETDSDAAVRLTPPPASTQPSAADRKQNRRCQRMRTVPGHLASRDTDARA